MEALRLILRYAHLIGFALLLGGAVMQYLSGKFRINPAMLWGAIIQVLTGIGLAAPLRGGGDAEPDPIKLGVKLLTIFFHQVRVMLKLTWGNELATPSENGWGIFRTIIQIVSIFRRLLALLDESRRSILVQKQRSTVFGAQRVEIV